MEYQQTIGELPNRGQAVYRKTVKIEKIQIRACYAMIAGWQAILIINISDRIY
jgi:hypothetical protein